VSAPIAIADIKPCYTAIESSNKYLTSLQFFTNKLTGILILKPLANDTIWAVFVNEMGFKFLEYKITPTNHEVIYSLGKFNTKSTNQMMVNHFRLIANLESKRSRIDVEKKCIGFVKTIYYIDSTYGLLGSKNNNCIFRNKVWVVKNNQKYCSGKMDKDGGIETRQVLLPIVFGFKKMD
jgi:hypothetical protein